MGGNAVKHCYRCDDDKLTSTSMLNTIIAKLQLSGKGGGSPPKNHSSAARISIEVNCLNQIHSICMQRKKCKMKYSRILVFSVLTVLPQYFSLGSQLTRYFSWLAVNGSPHSLSLTELHSIQLKALPEIIKWWVELLSI